MPVPESSAPQAPARRRPLCTIGTWVVPAFGTLVTYMFYQDAAAHRSGGEMLPGLDQLILGSMITAGLTVGIGVAAFFRREKNSWLALLPFLASLGLLLSFGWNYLRHTMGIH